ncbi:hypothetical protein AJ80_00567 [Polytolypa hystricis UAMH7299]|uniref:Hyaluronan/mRNA-binding protein domain-containing protein n=1 Tax=Polytolypa hystricis (strain UAMH7299) TaxID=1447883 RepID=A0A2B7Z3F7_POLH7|nr:hypothetical protein AJ80_00567 [Polytolypa hystricis UAMH7299]
MDEFAQTRGVDDLFDDEIIPVAPEDTVVAAEPVDAGEPVSLEVHTTTTAAAAAVAQEQAQPYQHEYQQQQQQQGFVGSEEQVSVSAREVGVTDAQPPPPQPPQQQQQQQQQYQQRGGYRGRGGERGRGRGRGGGRGGHNRREKDSAAATAPAPAAVVGQAVKPKGDEEIEKGETRDDKDKAVVEEGAEEGVESTESSTPAENGNEKKGKEGERVFAVRGDRSGTGGVKKPKLTEDELSARIAAAKANAAKLSAAHARAEADEAFFQERERVAAEKRAAEFQNRRVMNGERERNRQRKLIAQKGREWDAEKDMEEFAGRGRGSAYRRGMHGGVVGGLDGARDRDAGDALVGDLPSAATDGGNGYFRGGRGGGRGGRGGPRGRGRGRGDSFNGPRTTPPHTTHQEESGAAKPESTSSPAIDAETEFPALPTTTTTTSSAPKPQPIITEQQQQTSSSTVPSFSIPDSATTPITPQGTWADQVESSELRANSRAAEAMVGKDVEGKS